MDMLPGPVGLGCRQRSREVRGEENVKAEARGTWRWGDGEAGQMRIWKETVRRGRRGRGTRWARRGRSAEQGSAMGKLTAMFGSTRAGDRSSFLGTIAQAHQTSTSAIVVETVAHDEGKRGEKTGTTVGRCGMMMKGAIGNFALLCMNSHEL